MTRGCRKLSFILIKSSPFKQRDLYSYAAGINLEARGVLQKFLRAFASIIAGFFPRTKQRGSLCWQHAIAE